MHMRCTRAIESLRINVNIKHLAPLFQTISIWNANCVCVFYFRPSHQISGVRHYGLCFYHAKSNQPHAIKLDNYDVLMFLCSSWNVLCEWIMCFVCVTVCMWVGSTKASPSNENAFIWQLSFSLHLLMTMQRVLFSPLSFSFNAVNAIQIKMHCNKL